MLNKSIDALKRSRCAKIKALSSIKEATRLVARSIDRNKEVTPIIIEQGTEPIFYGGNCAIPIEKRLKPKSFKQNLRLLNFI